jgi:flagellar biosynthesis/type III secretory pathway protein FliH
MTWSSSDGSTGGADVTVASWDWKDLALPGHAADAAEREVLRVQELDAAYRRGRSEGEESAFGRARQELSTAVAAARRVLQEVRTARDAWDRSLEENLVALSTAIARHIVGRELEADPETFRDLVHKAAAAFPADQAVRVRVHPDELALLTGNGEVPLPEDSTLGGREARWLVDEEIVPGGCIVEGPDRIVDGRVDEALERLYWELTRG